VVAFLDCHLCISASGCWINSNGESRRTEEASGILVLDLETNKAKINAGTILKDDEMKFGKERKTGFWGHVMQIVYQVWNDLAAYLSGACLFVVLYFLQLST
jgi:hypothetical protein